MKTKNLPEGLLWFFILLHSTFFSYISLLKYNTFAYSDFDLAIDAQTVWNILHGSLESSIHQIVFLGNHMRVILFLVAPLYAVFNTPAFLLILQSVMLALAAYPLYKLAKEKVGTGLALSLVFAYFCYPAVGFLNLYEFHPTALATCFLMFTLYYFYKGIFSKFIIFASLSMMCQENIALIIAMFGAYALLKRRGPKWAWTPLLTGAVYFWLAIFRIMPHFSQGTINYMKQYGQLGRTLPEAAAYIFRHPARILFLLASGENASYLFQLFSPVMFLPLFFMEPFIVVLPIFMQHMLSLRVMERTIFYHYTAELIPFIFYAGVHALEKLTKDFSSPQQKRALIFGVMAFAALSTAHFGPYGKMSALIADLKDNKEPAMQKKRLLSKIPHDAAVVATFEFLPMLSHRKGLYSFHHVYNGYYTLSDKEYKLPENVEYALINHDDKFTFEGFKSDKSEENLREFFRSHNWKVLDSAGSCILYKKYEK